MRYIFLLILTLMSCTSFGFRGSLPSDIKTLYIENFENKASGGRNLTNDLSIKVTDSFIADNTLIQSSKQKADLIISGAIEQVVDNQVASFNAEGENAPVANQYKVFVKVRIKCFYVSQNKDLFQETLREEVTIASTASAFEKDQAIDQVLDKLSESIVDKVIGYW
ncbi:MAG: hypothetical protein KDD94_01120 [Calditrichaeota bacterium]|nr:hypothetical protein [Calditrichota bacterium]